LRALRIGAEDFAASQLLTTALALTLARPQGQVQAGEASSLAHCDRRLLWRLGLSGDRPILLVTAGAPQGLGLLRSLAKAMRVWAWGGIACDLVVVNAEPASYEMALHREISALRDRHVADTGAASGNTGTGFFVLRSDALTADQWSTLRCLARVRLHADGRPLIHHVQEWSGWHEKAFELRHDTSTTVVATIARREVAAPASRGEFDAATGNFTFETGAGVRPARPWINVLANPEFGAQLSEAGAGYSWALNSRLNQLTGWSNDPVGDPPSEWFLLQDLDTLAVWSAAPSAWGDAQANYQVVHGQGRSVISHRRGPLEVSAAWTVDPQSSVKQVRLRFVNRGTGAVNLRVTGLLEWVMGAGREDRASVQTALHRQRLPSSADSGESREPGRKRMLTALLCSQRERAAGAPDPLFDALVNRWLLYQTVSCRMWAKAGFYQAGGATAFATSCRTPWRWPGPPADAARADRAARAAPVRRAGDVQHWWHAPRVPGVRTHFSDDLLWLPHACAALPARHGRRGAAGRRVPFIEGPDPRRRRRQLHTPAVSAQQASVYEHAHAPSTTACGGRARPAADGQRRLERRHEPRGHEGPRRIGVAGLVPVPLVAEFAPLARSRGEVGTRLARWETRRRAGGRADGPAWDGAMVQARAFFDNGQPWARRPTPRRAST
jgi:cellobiose phosphorylase